MRLWSLHPHYLDRMGLLAVWRESLLAQSVLLKGEYTKCPDCNGAKEYKYFDEKIQNKIWETCTKCKGTGKIKTPYYNHSQLERFKRPDGYLMIGIYLVYIWAEANKRGYNFDRNKISNVAIHYTVSNQKPLIPLTVTKGQLIYEFEHLQNKLKIRCPETWGRNDIEINQCNNKIQPHPLFKIIEGDIESWEKVK